MLHPLCCPAFKLPHHPPPRTWSLKAAGGGARCACVALRVSVPGLPVAQGQKRREQGCACQQLQLVRGQCTGHEEWRRMRAQLSRGAGAAQGVVICLQPVRGHDACAVCMCWHACSIHMCAPAILQMPARPPSCCFLLPAVGHGARDSWGTRLTSERAYRARGLTSGN